jgi:hypothetical protein
MSELEIQSSRAQASRAAISRLYIAMRHLFIRGSYKPLGASGEAMINALLELNPEIYGSIADPERLELDGLLYIFQRLPQGIEECRYVKLITREGYEKSFTATIANKRRRDCYRIDEEQYYLEMTRGRSDIYDVLTHLTFMYIEAEKIMKNALDSKNRPSREWQMLEKIVGDIQHDKEYDRAVGFSYLSTLIGRTYEDTEVAFYKFSEAKGINNLFNIIYWLGKYAIEEHVEGNDREISFSTALRERLGHHIYGELWASKIKTYLIENNLLDRPIHIISSNLHSVMNSFYAKDALKKQLKIDSLLEVAEELSIGENKELRNVVKNYALKNGMAEITDTPGVNISVQIFDCAKMHSGFFPKELSGEDFEEKNADKVLVVMDYAFGEQAYECMDELLKPAEHKGDKISLDIRSINIMGKAGILEGKKGDIMIPSAHIFEGTADNYPFENKMDCAIFDGSGLNVYKGPMITVLGTSLQNKDILRYFYKSSWKSVGLEMEGAHYQKAIQAASKIRSSISKDVVLRYAYYASDNPLETGATLSSGALGKSGVKPTYLITIGILNGILDGDV